MVDTNGTEEVAAGRIARPVTGPSSLPDRYSVKGVEGRRFLSCLEAPNLRVRVERGYSAAAAAARRSESHTIFLDGAAQGPPFLDTERQVYNLDHHEDCVRPFTLATCEQAYVLVRKGLGLDEREWVVRANEPDLDTVLAIWILLNHRRCNDPEIRATILPLVRLEGVIDVHGLELKELSCLSPERLQETDRRLSDLTEVESRLKREGRWSSIDWLEYTAGLLRRIDAVVYTPRHFSEFLRIDELARVELAEDQLVVVCRSDAGIYEVERQLVELHKNRLALVALQKDRNSYTLRRVKLFLPLQMDRIYERLNLMDPAVGIFAKGNSWGGAADIGGSPRRTGTRLSAQEIVDTIEQTFRRPSVAGYARMAAQTAAGLSALVLPWWLLSRWLSGPLLAGFLVVLFGLSMFAVAARRHPRLYGIAVPVSRSGWTLLPVALVAALCGGAWIPTNRPESFLDLTTIGLLLALPLLAECFFRGWIHGIWRRRLRTQRGGGKWFVSWPAAVSSVSYAAVTWLGLSPLAAASTAPLQALLGIESVLARGIGTAAALVFGLACASARERSGSLLGPVIFHWLSAAAVLLFAAAG